LFEKARGDVHAAVTGMDAPSAKPYEIKVRVFDTASLKVWSQVIASSTSTGAHLEEAAAGGSRAQFLALIRGALREMRESHYWLRIITATQLTGHESVVMPVEESRELVAILTSIARNADRNRNC
jgi:four helix bundle protein